MSKFDIGIFLQDPLMNIDLVDIKIARVRNQFDNRGTALVFVLFGMGIEFIILDKN